MLDDILKSQHSFARKATSHAEHRFDNLYHVLKRDDWLNTALDAVLQNSGARTGGIDGVTKKHFEQKGFREQFITTLRAELATKQYQPQPVRRQYIPKAGGKTRPLGIPTIRDRVVQMLLKMLLEPIFESDFLDCSTGFRPGRSTMDALAVCYRLINPRNKYYYVIEGDIRSYFDKVNHDILLKLVARRIKDVNVLNLIGRFLKAGVMEGQVFRRSPEGTPQGGILSPLLANVYLHELDRWWWEHYGSIDRHAKERRRKNGQANCIYVRYADDWVALCNGTKAQAEAIRDEIRDFLCTTLQLELSAEKTVVTHACDGFDFLGFHVQHYPAHGGQKAVTLARPSEKSVERLKDKVRDITDRAGFADNPMDKFYALNAVLRGWMNYYRHCSASQLASWLDHWVHLRVADWLVKRHKSCYREVLEQYLKQEGTRKNFAVKRADGSDLFLYLMKDVHITPYRAHKHTNPYLLELQRPIGALDPEVPLADNTWSGRSALAAWRNTKDVVVARDGHQCADCGSRANLDVHHILPRRNGGKDTLDNLITLCERCHVAGGGYGRPRKNV
ncbi:MAG: group II intron reverse transcriptase/maturase [Chloroflexota bacterium]|nr:group II intron reverse transcriptase/maturase [Chloroflexota bacterium]